jgi:hypothetical protein
MAILPQLAELARVPLGDLPPAVRCWARWIPVN